MSFEKPSETSITFKCDGCGREVGADLDVHTNGPSLFTLAWHALSDVGWTTQKAPNMPWDHYCGAPACQSIAAGRKGAQERREYLRDKNGR